MRIYKILFFLLAVILFSCGEPTPADILNHEQMAGVLVDVHLADGSLFTVSQDPDSLYKYGSYKYQALFKQHQTDSTQFKKSFKYYTNKPDQLLEIYEKVYAVIKVRADSAAVVKAKTDSLERIKQQKIAKRVTDSIARVNKLKADSAAKKRKKAKPDTVLKKNTRAVLMERAKKFKGKNVIPRK